MNREGRAAMTRENYCGNLLWQSSPTLFVPRDAPQDARETRRRYPADEVSCSGRWMQRAGGVALFPEARDERMCRLPSSRECPARLCFGPTPGGTRENETSRAGLRPEGIYVYVERSQGRANRPFLVGEHGCPKQSRTLEGKHTRRPKLANLSPQSRLPAALQYGIIANL